MNASAWIALASLAGFVLLQTGVALFALGGLFRDVKALRENASGTDCKAELAVLNTKFEALERTLSEMATDVKGLLTGRSRRRASDDA